MTERQPTHHPKLDKFLSALEKYEATNEKDDPVVILTPAEIDAFRQLAELAPFTEQIKADYEIRRAKEQLRAYYRSALIGLAGVVAAVALLWDKFAQFAQWFFREFK